MKLLFKTNLRLGFAVLFLLLSYFGWRLYNVSKESNTNAEWVTHTHEVMLALEEVYVTSVDIQTGERGYVITSNEEFLKPLQNGIPRVRQLTSALRKQKSSNTIQLKNLDSLESSIEYEIKISEEIVNLHKNNGAEAASAAISSKIGNRSMDRIRYWITVMNDEEKKLLESRVAASKESNASQAFLLNSSLGLLFAFTTVLFFSIKKYPAIYEKNQKDLERRVKEQTDVIGATLASNADLKYEIYERKNAEEAMRRAEAKYRHTLDAMMEGCIIFNYDWVCIYINDTAAKFAQKPKEDLYGFTIQEMYPDIMERSTFTYLKRCMEERESQYIQSEVLSSAGVPTFFDIKIHPVEEGVFIHSVDITERKLTEQKLKKSETMLMDSGKLALVGGWEIETETMRLTCSSQVYDIYELEYSKDFVFENGLAAYPPEAQLIIEGAINRCIEFGEPWELDVPFITSKGNHRWVKTQGRAEFVNDKCVRIYGALQDITKSKIAEDKLRKSEEQFRLITENVADMIAVLDLEGKRIYNSPSYKAILGDPKLYEGTDSFLEIHPDDKEKIRTIFRETVETGKGQKAEYRFMLKDGSTRYIESEGSIIRDYHGNISQVIVVSRDVTEKKLMEHQFLRVQRMESIGTLAGGIAHDLNNILSPILLSISMLRKKVSDDQAQRTLNLIESAAMRGAELIKQVLSFARGVDGEFTNLQVRHLIEEIHKIVHETFPKSIYMQVKVPKTLPTIFADPTHIHQVLMNLCVNARDAMPNGGRLDVEAETMILDEQYVRMHLDAKAGKFVVITVTDQGMGIPPKVMERIFEPFFTTKGIGEGTGLGLSTVMAIIKSHGGFVSVYSEIGKGTMFKVYLPAQEGEDTYLNGIEDKRSFGNGELILVVDDEESIRDITKITLEEHGYSVLTAADGVEAVALYAKHGLEIALVISDMMMPIMDGASTVRILQKMNPQVKVIVVSGLKQSADIVSQEKINFLHKPYTSEKLVNLICRVLHPDTV